MGIYGFFKVIGDYVFLGLKENEIKNYFGKWEFYLWLFVMYRFKGEMSEFFL